MWDGGRVSWRRDRIAREKGGRERKNRRKTWRKMEGGGEP